MCELLRDGYPLRFLSRTASRRNVGNLRTRDADRPSLYIALLVYPRPLLIYNGRKPYHRPSIGDKPRQKMSAKLLRSYISISYIAIPLSFSPGPSSSFLSQPISNGLIYTVRILIQKLTERSNASSGLGRSSNSLMRVSSHPVR